MVTRTYLIRGDKANNGAIISGGSDSYFWHNVPVAREGDAVYCPVCKRAGKIVCVGPRVPCSDMGKEVALSGDICVCGCQPAPVFYASRPFTMTVDARDLLEAGTTCITPTDEPREGMQKLVDEPGGRLIDDAERLCPNMSNAEFSTHIMRLRDEALKLVAARLAEIPRWLPSDQRWFEMWFGTLDSSARDAIAAGLVRMTKVLSTLTPANFVRYSPVAMQVVGCVSRKHSPGAVAEVCAPDTATHTIAIRLDFCTLRPRHPRFDSQLLTLVHEVSHFTDVFGSLDHWYSTHNAKDRAQARDRRTIENADNIAGYIVCSE
ncbi:PAAR domain-containing protein [Cupriavidus pinatubonensis]|uniref:PAAR domain-containing protein n=1 Tax=Cupriavidus pinatubonensis TaxID=248026 RepID=UPI003620206E